MKRAIAKFLAVPVVAAGILGGVAVSAPSALAATDTSGTVAVTLPFSYVAALAKAGVVEFPVPLSELSVNKTNQTVTVTFTVTGGNGDVNVFFGDVNLSGSVVIASASGHAVKISGLFLDVFNGDIAGTPAGATAPVPLLDVAGSVTFAATSTSQSYNASDLTIDPAGAAYLDSALYTSAFVANADTGGSMAATWAVTP